MPSMHTHSTSQEHSIDEHGPLEGTPGAFATDLYEDGYSDPVYQAKAQVLNRAIQEIGMGRYQWHLFIIAGFGGFTNGVGPVFSSFILIPVLYEFHFDAPFLALAKDVGLLVGAIFWGFGCDIWGRRWSYNLTLLITGIFGLAAGGAPNFITLASLLAIATFGAGGSFPVDFAVFLDFLPGSHQYLLTILSVWNIVGALTGGLIAWPLIANFSCSSPENCTRSQNMGWRYLLFAFSGLVLLLWCIRFFFFTLLESPRFLSGIGRDKEVVDVIHRLAKYNGKTTTLTVEELEAPGCIRDKSSPRPVRSVLHRGSKYDMGHIKALFSTARMALATSLLIAIWGAIGLGSTLYHSFLPYILTTRDADFGDGSLYITYRNLVILGVISIPAALLSGWAVELPYVGRRGSLAVSLALTGAFLYATTIARTPNQLLGWNCGYAFCTSIMTSVLRAISPEIFPAKDRGTGNGLTMMAYRVFGVMASVVALYTDLATAKPVYISGGVIIFAGFLAVLLPYEPRGKASI